VKGKSTSCFFLAPFRLFWNVMFWNVILLFACNISCYINVLNGSCLFSLLSVEQFKSLTLFKKDADGDEVCV
jgi:hypothetical protein